MKFSEFAIIGKRRLQAAKIQCADPALHVRQMIEFVLGGDGNQWVLRWNEEIPEGVLVRLEELLARREAGEPFQYLTGEEWFWKSRFSVGPGVFIPRKETETLVEALLGRVGSGEARVAELGAGSGNIGISLLLERPTWHWHAFEVTPAAQYARRNREALLPASSSYTVYEEDFFSGAERLALFDALVSNPPYVREDEMRCLPVEVTHEPVKALDGGKEGLEVLLRLVEAGREWLRPGGTWAAEIDYRQADALRERLDGAGFCAIEVRNDLAGLPRVVLATKKE